MAYATSVLVWSALVRYKDIDLRRNLYWSTVLLYVMMFGLLLGTTL